MPNISNEEMIFNSLVTFNGDVQGLPNYKNVIDITKRPFRARKGTTYNSGPAIQNAINQAAQNPKGGIVYLPGDFRSDQDIVVPVVTDRGIYIVGDGKRMGQIYPTTPGGTAIRFGTNTPDASGTSTNLTQYCGMIGIGINGSLLTSGTSIGLQVTEMQRGMFGHFIIEGYTKGSSIGMYLRGSTTVGLGSASNPQVWNCYFPFITIATSMRPLVLENVDECYFISMVAGCPTGLVGAADANKVIELIQGHSNNWNRLTLSGDRSAQTAYAGISFNQPTKGDMTMNSVDHLVAEGFNDPIIFGGNLVAACGVRDFDSSINLNFYKDNAPQVGTRNYVIAPLHHINYINDAPAYTDALTITGNSATPDVSGGQVFLFANAGATNVTNLLNGHNGDVKVLKLDANTTIVNGGSIRNASGANYSGAGKMLIASNYGGIWNIGALA